MTAAEAAPSPAQLGGQAARAVRALNHLTRPGAGAPADPLELCDLVAELSCVAGRLPQLLGQLSGWLAGEQSAGRLRVDAGALDSDPAVAVTTAIDCLTLAGDCAHHAGRALDAAQQTLAHLASAEAASDHQDRS